MRTALLLLLSAALLLAACKTQQKPVAESVPPSPVVQPPGMTEEQKQQLLQSEYQPPSNSRPEKPPEADMATIISLAKPCAELTCEIKFLEYKISQGEQVDPGLLKEKKASLEELSKKNKSLFDQHPGWEYYFNEHLQQFMDGCK
jgi:hypothetical protein